MKRVILCGWLVALLLGGCSLASGDGPSSGKEIVSQANEGDKIAFGRSSADFTIRSIVTMNSDGTGLTTIQTDAFNPVWGPAAS